MPEIVPIGPPALEAATALIAGATLLVTNDRDLARLEPTVAILVLEDIVP